MNNNYKVILKIQTLKFDKVILAAGSKSSEILSNSQINNDSYRVPVCLNGVGSALEVFSELEYLKPLKTDSILRSPNRGGTCGIHMVQRSKSVYIGASSVATDHDLKYPLSSVGSDKGANNEQVLEIL